MAAARYIATLGRSTPALVGWRLTAMAGPAYGPAMSLDVLPWREAGRDAVRELLLHPSLAREFDSLAGPRDLRRMLAHPDCHPGMRWVGRDDGRPAAVTFAFLLPGAAHPWAMIRLGVLDRHRRRGLGTRLLEAQIGRLAALQSGCGEVCLSAWEPCPDAEAFARARGFAVVRRYWMMERPGNDLPAPDWPSGIELRPYDGSAAALSEWNDIFNRSFAEHYHFVPSTLDFCRSIAERPDFDPSCLLLAYDGDRCVGLCRNQVREQGGEIAVVGVAPGARGRGLGRALLRWGTRWLAEHSARPITLMVDGGNERALALYRSERFEVARTRRVWGRAFHGNSSGGAS